MALIGLAGALATLLSGGWLIFRLARKIPRFRPEKPLSPMGLTRIASAFCVAGFGSAIFFLCFAILSQFYAYQALTATELVGELECLRELGPRRFDILYTPIEDGVKGAPIRVELTGDQWLVGADLLRWKPFMNYLGFQTSFKITRLEGRYLTATDQRIRPITAYDLNGGTDAVWLALYRGRSVWPYGQLVDAVYGSAAYQLLREGSGFQILVGNSGLIARPLDDRPSDFAQPRGREP